MYLVTAENGYGEMTFTDTAETWDGVKSLISRLGKDGEYTVNSIAVWQQIPVSLTLTVEAK